MTSNTLVWKPHNAMTVWCIYNLYRTHVHTLKTKYTTRIYKCIRTYTIHTHMLKSNPGSGRGWRPWRQVKHNTLNLQHNTLNLQHHHSTTLQVHTQHSWPWSGLVMDAAWCLDWRAPCRAPCRATWRPWRDNNWQHNAQSNIKCNARLHMHNINNTNS